MAQTSYVAWQRIIVAAFRLARRWMSANIEDVLSFSLKKLNRKDLSKSV